MRNALIAKSIVIMALAAASSARAQDAVPDPFLAATLTPEAARAVEGINGFTVDLYRRVAQPAHNVLVSPASVSLALALTYRGAQGRTADELRTVLRYSTGPSGYLAAQAPVLDALNFVGEGRELHVVNAVWVQAGLPLDPAYLADVTANARAAVQRIDYRADPDAARRTINSWVAEWTGHRIKELLLPPDVTHSTRLALVNAVYWKGRWTNPFSPAETRTAPFRPSNGRSMPTTMMTRRGVFAVARRDTLSMIELPYGQGEVSMVVLLPNDARNGVPRLEAGLTGTGLTRLLAELERATGRDTILTLPKLHIEGRDDLVPVLREMGIRAAFSDTDEADFSALATEPYPGEIANATGLSIKHVIHQTFLDVDEAGSEATAATAVTMDVVVTGLRRGPPPPPPFVFRADRPFLFLLRDRRTKAILFIGHYVGPGPAVTPAATAAPPPR